MPVDVSTILTSDEVSCVAVYVSTVASDLSCVYRLHMLGS